MYDESTLLMVEWLGRGSQGHEMYCPDLKVMDLNPGRVELGVLLLKSYLNQNLLKRLLS